MNNLKNKNGITLIALVITIIVMLILAGVTITMAVNGGLFDYAKRAGEETEIARDEELIMSSLVGWGVEKYTGNKTLAQVLAADFGAENVVAVEGGAEVTLSSGKTYIVSENGTITEKTGITLNKIGETLAIVEGEAMPYVDLTATLTGISGTITWQNGNTSAVDISATEGETIRVTAKAAGTSVITATCSGKTATCTVKVTVPVEATKGMFIAYNVEYTDVYKGYEYTSKNGWRLLDYTDNGDGTLSNVKLISTGVPAKLYYYYNQGNNEWFVTETGTTNTPNLPTFKTLLGGEYDATNNPNGYVFYTGTSTYYGLQASAGMYYNLGSIKFTNGTSNTTAWGTSANADNRGWFTSIKNGATEYNSTTNTGKTVTNGTTAYTGVTGDNLFKARNDASIRLLTLPELNAAAGRTTDPDSISGYTGDTTGLYKLSAISTGTTLTSNTYNDGYYWLASPFPSASNNGNVCYVLCGGGISNDSGNYLGVRPVVCLTSDITLTEVTEDGWTYYTMD